MPRTSILRERAEPQANVAFSDFTRPTTMKIALLFLLICSLFSGIQIANADDSRLIQTTGYGVDGLVLWLAADSGVTRDSNNKVTALVDKTKNFTLTPNGSEQAPTFVPNGLNGKPVLRFNGNQSLYSSNNFGTALNRDMTMIIVAMTTASPDYEEFPLFMGQDATPATNRGFAYYRGKDFFDGHYAGSFGGPMITNAFVVSAASIDSTLTQVTFYRNGTRSMVSGPAAETMGRKFENLSPGLTMGATPGSSGDWQGEDALYREKLRQYPVTPVSSAGWQGDIAEELVYDRQLTDAEVQSIWQQLSDKYDLPQAIAPQAPQPAPPDDLGRPLVIKEPCGFGDPLPLIIAFGVGIVVVGGICFYLIFDRLNKIALVLRQE